MEYRRTFQPGLTAIFILLSTFFSFSAVSQNGPEVYKIFDKSGKEISWKKIVKSAGKADAVFFGEFHDDPIAHYLQLQLLKALANFGNYFTLGLEMLEWTDAELLAKYMSDEIDERAFMKEAQSLWKNYTTDYAPLVRTAKQLSIPVFASNIPRAWASGVYKFGFEFLDTLSSDLKKYLPPLPIPYDPDLPQYRKMLEMIPGHGGENFPKAQAIKDASMAWSIVKRLSDGYKVLHLNGAYHTNNFEGIIWYVKQYIDNVKILSITTVRQENIKKLDKEHIGIADFIIAVPMDMIRTH